MRDEINTRLPRVLWQAIVTQAIEDRRSATAELAVVVEVGLATMAATRAPKDKAA